MQKTNFKAVSTFCGHLVRFDKILRAQKKYGLKIENFKVQNLLI